MAKFAVSLCILLVVCSGTSHGTLISELRDVTLGRFSNVRTTVDQLVSRSNAILNESVGLTNDLINSTTNTVDAAIASVQNQLDAAASSVQNTTACTTEATDLINRLSATRNATNSCAAQSLAKVQAKYDALINSSGSLRSGLNEVQTEFVQCLAGRILSVSCTFKAVSQLYGNISSELNSVTNAVASLTLETTNYSQTLIACASTDGLNNLLNQVADINTRLSNCVANLEATV